MRRVLVVLAALTLASCGPKPAEQARICAIFALPGVPGDSQVGDAYDLAWAKAGERALFKSGAIYGPGWQVLSHGHSWGRCPVRAKPIEHLLISPDHGYAMTKGGRRANGHPTSFGACYYQKGEAGWRLRACRKTLNDPVPLVPFKTAKPPAS
ncbi:hypothetical protein [Caulobacter sp. DWR2-3-1b2]|uniref:hypothetical protein n=1 Tax=unclassified Caulobacter TaxID=2648921 RepID=UPI003CF82EC6